MIGGLVARPMLRIRVTYNESDGLSVSAKYAFIERALFPRVKRMKLKDYTRKHHERALKKKRGKKDKKYKVKKKEAPVAKARRLDVKSLFPALSRIARRLYSKFLRKLRIDIRRIRVTVATGDAAETAIAYGVVSQSLAYFLEFTDRMVKLKTKRESEISVNADFIAERSSADIDISFCLSLGNVISNGSYLAYEYLKNSLKSKTKKLDNKKQIPKPKKQKGD